MDYGCTTAGMKRAHQASETQQLPQFKGYFHSTNRRGPPLSELGSILTAPFASYILTPIAQELTDHPEECVMCGIVGIVNFDSCQVSEDLLIKMRDSLHHRGPDDAGLYIDGSVGLGHRRLSILDLSQSGRQPMCNDDQTVWITYNGEIYNYQDIRKDLEGKGYVFRSRTDTEVLLHAYEEWGTDCVQKLNGMFAFGLWDTRSRSLWLARDRIGIKPLFYACHPSFFAFASEIKGLLPHPQLSHQIDYKALAYFLALNWVPAPQTLFSGIRQLLPGQHMIVERDGTIRERQYWELGFPENGHKTEKEWIDDFNTLVEDAVRLQLVSDVPFGAFLSGGVDSSSVCYWMSMNMSSRLKTFSIVFDEESYNESPYAREVAHSLGTEHTEIAVTADAASVLPALVWHGEEPTANSSMLPMYYLARETRKHVTMVQSGDGSDEVLAGYETYQAYYATLLYRKFPSFFRNRVIQPLVHSLPVSDAKVSWSFKLKRFVSGAEHMPEDAHATWRMICDSDLRRKLLRPIWNQAGVQSDVLELYRSYFAKCPAQHPLNRMLWVDTRLYLPNDGLVKIDRMAMANSLEVRVPLLDHRLVELAASVPPSLKLKQLRVKKYLLKKAMEGKLPDKIIHRRKAGFNVPVGQWVKSGMKDFVMDILSPQNIRETGLLDEKAVSLLLEDHLREKADYSFQIWGLLVLVLWLRRFA